LLICFYNLIWKKSFVEAFYSVNAFKKIHLVKIWKGLNESKKSKEIGRKTCIGGINTSKARFYFTSNVWKLRKVLTIWSTENITYSLATHFSTWWSRSLCFIFTFSETHKHVFPCVCNNKCKERTQKRSSIQRHKQEKWIYNFVQVFQMTLESAVCTNGCSGFPFWFFLILCFLCILLLLCFHIVRTVIYVQFRFAQLFMRHKKLFSEEYWPLRWNRVIRKRVETYLTRISTMFFFWNWAEEPLKFAFCPRKVCAFYIL
jgi:uncharacterized membrane protein YhdT